jgi:hypothetical protein
MPGDMEAVISALEQARAALDEVEASATGQRRERLAKPPVEAPGETCEGCGKALGECDCKDDAAEME